MSHALNIYVDEETSKENTKKRLWQTVTHPTTTPNAAYVAPRRVGVQEYVRFGNNHKR